MKKSFLPILFLIFLTLKLTGHITWSWWWVFSPLLAPFAGLAIVFGLAGVIAGFLEWTNKK